MKKWFSRKLWVAIGGTVVLMSAGKLGLIPMPEALDKMSLLWMSYLAAQGVTDAAANLKKES